MRLYKDSGCRGATRESTRSTFSDAPQEVRDMERMLLRCHDQLVERLEKRFDIMQEQLAGRPPVLPPALADVPPRPSLGTELLFNNSGGWQQHRPETQGTSGGLRIAHNEAALGLVAGDASSHASEDVAAKTKPRPPLKRCRENVRHTRSCDSDEASNAVAGNTFSDLGLDISALQPSPPDVAGNCITRLVKSWRFELMFGVMIVTNAAFIGVQTDYAISTLSGGDGGNQEILDIVNIFYAAIFTVELVLKVLAYRRRFLFDPDTWHWNILDTIIVGASIVEVGATLALGFEQADTSDSKSTFQFRVLRILRITRLIKVIRITRIVRFIRALRTMVFQLMSTFKALMWAVLLLLLIIYLFAIVFTQTVYLHLSDGGQADPALMLHWASLPRSMLVLFEATTGGIGWEEVLQPLATINAFPVCLFVAYIAFTQFAVLNILTGVFCQNAIDSARHDQELAAQDMLANKQEYVNEITKIFKDFDTDRSGAVTIAEFMAHLHDENVRAYLESLDLDTSDICTLFRLLDSSDKNEIALDEFVSGCMRLKGFAKSVDLAKLNYAQSSLAKRLARFMDRTDGALGFLLDQVRERGLESEPSPLERVEGRTQEENFMESPEGVDAVDKLRL